MLIHKPVVKTSGSMLSGSVEEKLLQLEQKLLRVGRANSNYVIGMAPRIPIMEYVDELPENEVVFRKLIPTDSIITVGYLFIKSFSDKSDPMAVISVESASGETTIVKLPIKKGMNKFSPDAVISAGQMVTLSISNVANCIGIWAGFVLEITGRDLTKEKYVVEDILSLENMSDEDLINE